VICLNSEASSDLLLSEYVLGSFFLASSKDLLKITFMVEPSPWFKLSAIGTKKGKGSLLLSDLDEASS